MAKKKAKDGGGGKPGSPRIRNRRAWHDYHIIEKVECGIELVGTEVKSIRNGQVKLDEAHARVKNGEVFLIGAEISLYPQAVEAMQHHPNRPRKLLLHKRQIAQIERHVAQKGRTVVPLELYFNRGWAKLSLGLAEGRQQFDKRDSIKKRDQQRDIDRDLRHNR